MAKTKTKPAVKSLDMIEIIGRCVERSLQKHVDEIVNECLDPRIKKLITGRVMDLLLEADVAPVSLPKESELPETTPKKEDQEKTLEDILSQPTPIEIISAKSDVDEITDMI